MITLLGEEGSGLSITVITSLGEERIGYFALAVLLLSKKISNDQELIQSDPKSCPQNQKRK